MRSVYASRRFRPRDGKRYTYDKDGLLTRIQIYKAGKYFGDDAITDEDRQ